jgi:hypothetical protein
MPPGPDYTIFAITDLSMCTSTHDGGTSFLEAYAAGSKLKVDDSVMNESETSDPVDPTYGFADFIQIMDIILVGRGSYDLIMHHNSGHWPYPQKRLIVFTATPLTEPIPPRPDSSRFGTSTATKGLTYFIRICQVFNSHITRRLQTQSHSAGTPRSSSRNSQRKVSSLGNSNVNLCGSWVALPFAEQCSN